MCLLTGDYNFPRVSSCHSWSFSISNHTIGCRINMQAKNYIGFVFLKNTFFEHKFGTTFFAYWWSFFSWLKNEHNTAGKFSFMFGKKFCYSHQDSHMSVVTAGMHDANIQTIKSSFFIRGKG